MSAADLLAYQERHPRLFQQPPPAPGPAGAGFPCPPAEPVPATTLQAGQSLRFVLPYPPSLNRIWRAIVTRRNGKIVARILLSLDGRAYRRKVIAHVAQLDLPALPGGARLALHLHACAPDRRKRDLSNIPKSLEDALTHAQLWADDSLIDDLRVTRGPITRPGHVIVTITPIPGAHHDQ